ncbi:uncharacterized protein BDZ83DRAFT_203581 [Colletotrichum acutatum]|uniref:Uncharacterized protein n=1 Tax=Glomerella acutata TaxID=27357 RepID=A0AAD8UN65_GLOAC|nr:uncharacterized protein BDZ83DRAFT_203581 [Colletotrichum acutatum]KAK1727427.1 hypothetical protein BDZ83DRAFT_203581 [Colletotrichum acutatum]
MSLDDYVRYEIPGGRFGSEPAEERDCVVVGGLRLSRCESWDGVGGKNTVSSLGTGGPMPAQAKRHYWSPRKRKGVGSNGSWILGDGGRERRVVDDFKGGTRLATDA